MAKQVNKQVVGGVVLAGVIAAIALGLIFIPSLRRGDPTFPAKRAEFEKEQPRVAAQVYLARAESKLNKRAENPAAGEEGIEYLRHVVYPAAGKGPALDPTSVAAARRLRDTWLAMGWEKLQK